MAAENKGEVPTSQSHRFRFQFDAQEDVEVTCTSCSTSCGTVLQALETSDEFNSREEGELRIELKNKGYIVPDFPCKLIGENELLCISVEKTSGEASKETQIPKPEYKSEKPMYRSDKLITFRVNAQGGKNMKILLDNSKLKSKGDPLYIFAINGETLEDALKRDGRFPNIVFDNKCYFNDVKAEKPLKLEFGSPVNSMDKRKFEICKDRKTHSKKSDSKTPVDGLPQPFTSKTEGNPNSKSPETRKEEGTARKLSFSERQKCVVPGQEETLNILRNQFGGLVEQLMKRHEKENYSSLLSHIGGEFGKERTSFFECGRFQKLLNLAEAVCKINAVKQGTGFLLFDHYILTNAHLFEIDGKLFTDGQKLHCEVTATFQKEHPGIDVEMKIKPDLIAFQWGTDCFKRYIDFAILELEDHNFSVNGLLCQYGHEPKSSGLCIFGHPSGHPRYFDFTKVIKHEKREDTLVTRMGEGINTYYLLDDLNRVMTQETALVTYDTCLFHGASGGPVFDGSLQVIGMHTGGLPYEKDSTKSYIEYAIPIRNILENVLINMTSRNKEEMLVKFTQQATTCPSLFIDITNFINHIIKEWPGHLVFPALKLWKTVMESEECNTQDFTDTKSLIERCLLLEPK